MNHRTKLTSREQLAMLQHRNGLPHSDYHSWTHDDLVQEIIRLQLQVAELTKQNYHMGWKLYPESMGR